MKCPKCGKEILETDNFCSNCNMNLSFTTKRKDSYQKIGDTLDNIGEKANKLNGIIILISAIAVIGLLLVISFTNFFLLLKILVFIKLYAQKFIIAGVISLLIWAILFFVKKRGILVKILFILSLILIVAPAALSNLITVDGDLSFVLKNYSKSEYIEIGDEKIPTLYSVVGDRKILFNIAEKDHYDDDMDLIMDFITLIYGNISNDDKAKYGAKLVELGFKSNAVNNEDGIIYLYGKQKNERYYVVSVFADQITYSTGVGSFEEVVEKMNEGE
ncbi:MAG: zinc ribbon domain-containing protein [Bacilli bacterium]|nr:zinc ribbon domain-containing protein [Bacilli bacterium]